MTLTTIAQELNTYVVAKSILHRCESHVQVDFERQVIDVEAAELKGSHVKILGKITLNQDDFKLGIDFMCGKIDSMFDRIAKEAA